MSVRDGPLRPMTMSGHCQFGPDHTKCKRVDCTCICHQPGQLQKFAEKQPPAEAPQPRKIHRTRRKLL